MKHSRLNADFGRGFYTTPIHSQAVSWCGKFKRRGAERIVSCYEFNENAYNECRIKAFESIAGLCDPFHHRLRKYTEPCIESNPAFW
ncbi:MAG: DUF3990 domain-containing protein [Lachnospiraceae bacterium]|nr:DUF3990 domain-containing protein [Lachnospiraceae bacterium]